MFPELYKITPTAFDEGGLRAVLKESEFILTFCTLTQR